MTATSIIGKKNLALELDQLFDLVYRGCIYHFCDSLFDPNAHII